MFFRKRSFLLPASICNAYKAMLCLVLVCYATAVSAQQPAGDTSDKIRIHILNNRYVDYNETDSGKIYKFIGDVIMQQGTDTLYCDSLYRNEKTRILEAFSNVRIAQQDGTQATSNYLSYREDKKLAFMKGNVVLTDGKNHLETEELTYNLDTKTGVYSKGGTLHNDTTTITSRAGIYNVRSKDVHFTGKVVITDPQYNIKSEDMMYNTESKITTFYAKSIVTSDSGKSVLETSDGTYDGKNIIAHFRGHASIWNDGQYIEADSTMRYNKFTGYGFAYGNVISTDTAHHSKIYCGHLEYLSKKRTVWATVKPVIEQVNGKDTLYMRADTFYMAPMLMKVIKQQTAVKPKKDSAAADSNATKRLVKKAKSSADTTAAAVPVKDSVDEENYFTRTKTEDTVWLIPEFKYRMPDYQYDTVKTVAELYKKSKRKKGEEAGTFQTVIPDTTSADTTAPIYFIGYHHVRIFSDSLQGKCDSVCYTRSDSTIRMIDSPVVWSHKSQITGDTILLHMDSSELRSLYVPNNAFLVSQSGPARAKLFDQVQGKTLTAYFEKNEITHMVVYPNAESIYFSKDDSGAYIGVNQSKSMRMRIFFTDQKITQIKQEQDPSHTMTPMSKADLPNTKLSKFKWLMDQRPKTKEELFD